jgi:serine/threonine protein kinase
MENLIALKEIFLSDWTSMGYTDIKYLTRGGFGYIYTAFDPKNTKVVLKVSFAKKDSTSSISFYRKLNERITASPEFSKYFVISTFFDSPTREDLQYEESTYIHQNLKSWLRECTWKDNRDLIFICNQLIKGLGVCDQLGIFFTDFKFSNILIDIQENGHFQIKFIDFYDSEFDCHPVCKTTLTNGYHYTYFTKFTKKHDRTEHGRLFTLCLLDILDICFPGCCRSISSFQQNGSFLSGFMELMEKRPSFFTNREIGTMERKMLTYIPVVYHPLVFTATDILKSYNRPTSPPFDMETIYSIFYHHVKKPKTKTVRKKKSKKILNK